MAENNPHKGHRARLKEEFLSHGLTGMADHKALELLLCFAIPQKDVNGLAHDLYDAFGSLAGVFNATTDQLMSVPGIGEHAACLIKLVPALGGRYQADCSRLGHILDTTERLGEYLKPHFFGERNEVTVVLCLDAKSKVLQCRKLAEGSADSTTLSLRKMLEVALACNASQVVLAHNHISNIAAPSNEDIVVTKMAYDVLQQVDITLRDHLIFAYDDYVSLRDTGVFLRL
jgi:DNA repair protein RadC